MKKIGQINVTLGMMLILFYIYCISIGHLNYCPSSVASPVSFIFFLSFYLVLLVTVHRGHQRFAPWVVTNSTVP